MGPDSQLDVLVINYNTRALLLECVASVLEPTPMMKIDVVVVDNASSDGSCEAVRKAYPHVTVIANPTNRGFGSACNQAISFTTAPFVLLLNSDARLTRQALDALWECMQRNLRCGAAGCKMINPEGVELANTWNFLTPFNQAFELSGFTHKVNSRVFRRSRQPSLNRDSLDCSVDWIDGSCLILRRAALVEVGLFDEQFFMYSEDEDLCLRLRKAGWSICFSSAGTAFHHGGASSAQNKSEMLTQFYLSQMRLLLKHHGRATLSAYAASMKAVLMTKVGFSRLLSKTNQGEEFQRRLTAFAQARSNLTLQKP
ncbi:MAG: glycosyltransferase family 2 protein [Acidobacteriia bacterium]|nr:glycosyltransferase family 2 protein [Terriglobia bacterium]